MYFNRIRLGGLLLMVVDKGVLGGSYSTSKFLLESSPSHPQITYQVGNVMSINKKKTCSILLQFIQDPHLLIAHHQTNKGFPSYDANPRNMQIWAPYQVAVYIALSWLQQFYPTMHISSMHTLYKH